MVEWSYDRTTEFSLTQKASAILREIKDPGWLFVQLIAAKDGEVERWKTVAAQALAAQKDGSDSLRALTLALERLERGSEARTLDCARNVDRIMAAHSNRFEDRPQ